MESPNLPRAVASTSSAEGLAVRCTLPRSAGVGRRLDPAGGQVVPGTPVGAPERPLLGRKAIWAAVIAAAIVGGIWLFLDSGFITRQDMMNFNRVSR